MDISLTPKERKKMIEDIMVMQNTMWIEMHRETKDELEKYNSPSLFRYYKAHTELKDGLK